MNYPLENSAAAARIELLVEISMTPNHPEMIKLSLAEALHIFHARKAMASWMFRVAIRLAPKDAPLKTSTSKNGAAGVMTSFWNRNRWPTATSQRPPGAARAAFSMASGPRSANAPARPLCAPACRIAIVASSTWPSSAIRASLAFQALNNNH